MAQTSYPWTGKDVGDVGPYTFEQWTDAWKAFSIFGMYPDKYGVLFGNLNNINPTIVTNDFKMDTGVAVVDGTIYKNSSQIILPITTPSSNSRINLYVLQKSWVNQVIGLVGKIGVESPTPVTPTVTQINGSLWELPIAAVHSTTGGTHTLRDYRQFMNLVSAPIHLYPGTGTQSILPGWSWFEKTGTTFPVRLRIYFTPFFLSMPMTIDQLELEVTTAGAGGSLLTAGIYDARMHESGKGILPGIKVIEGATDAVISSTGTKTMATAITLQPGWYFVAYIHDDTATEIVRFKIPDIVLPFTSPVSAGSNSVLEDYARFIILSNVQGSRILPDFIVESDLALTADIDASQIVVRLRMAA